jgi:pimeloyl-ACP methyl ester carboxylesterase
VPSFTSSRGFSISYRAEGTGPTLVLLGGLAQWADQWWDCGYGCLVDDGWQLIAVDRLGHGASDKPVDSAVYDERLIARDVVAVLNAESVQRAALWGFSLGAKNALSVAALHPDRVVSVVHGSGPLRTHADDPTARYESLAEAVSSDDGIRAVLGSLAMPRALIEEWVVHNQPECLVAALRGSVEWSASSDDLRAPMLWYVGADEGGFSDDELAYAQSRGIPTHVLPNANHWDAFRRASEVLDFVRPFLVANRSTSHP